MATHSFPRPVNNSIYDTLDERWYEAHDDPVALLRAESACRTPWVAHHIRARYGVPARVVDLGCGAGFLTNELAVRGHHVCGVDASEQATEVAARHDETGRVSYVVADVCRLPFDAGTFDAACAMDLLEHVEDPAAVIAEAARALAPGGAFFFHTFNRNLLAWLVVIKGVEWFVRNTPRDLHVLRLFVKPEEIRAMCAASGLTVVAMRGLRPSLQPGPLLRLAVSGRVPRDLRFVFARSTAIGYSGLAIKEPPAATTPGGRRSWYAAPAPSQLAQSVGDAP